MSEYPRPHLDQDTDPDPYPSKKSGIGTGPTLTYFILVAEERELSPDDKAINSLTVTIVSVSLVALALVGALIYLLVFIIHRKQ